MGKSRDVEPKPWLGRATWRISHGVQRTSHHAASGLAARVNRPLMISRSHSSVQSGFLDVCTGCEILFLQFPGVHTAKMAWPSVPFRLKPEGARPMTRPPEFRRQPAHGSLAAPGLVALPPPAESRPTRNLPSRDRQRSGAPAPMQGGAIPTISIHAFCETDGTTAALEAAGADRRLAKAHMEVSTGGIDRAIAECAGARAPNILVV